MCVTIVSRKLLTLTEIMFCFDFNSVCICTIYLTFFMYLSTYKIYEFNES